MKLFMKPVFWKPVFQFVRYNPFDSNFVNYLRYLPIPQCSCLENGVRVVTEVRNTPIACVGLFIDGGSRYENKFENGITRFYEQIVFKGTECRSKDVIAEEMNRSGAVFRNFTERELVGFTAECLSKQVPVILKLLMECVFRNSLAHNELHEQLTNALDDQLDQEQNYPNLVMDYLHNTAFQETPLGQSVIGRSNNLCNFSRDVLGRYLYRTFTSQRTVIVIVGNVQHELIASLVRNSLGDMPVMECPDATYDYRYTGSEVRFRDDTVPKANVAIAVEGPSYCDDDHLALDVAREYLGGWDKSQGGAGNNPCRLARACHEENLADAYQCFNIKYNDVSLWGVQFVSPSLKLEDMLYNVTDEFMYLCKIITEGEVARAKRQLKIKVLSKWTSLSSTCTDLARSVLFGNPHLCMLDRMREIDQVDVLHVQQVCETYLYDKCPAVAAVGPTEGLPEYTRIRAAMYWLRV